MPEGLAFEPSDTDPDPGVPERAVAHAAPPRDHREISSPKMRCASVLTGLLFLVLTTGCEVASQVPLELPAEGAPVTTGVLAWAWGGATGFEDEENSGLHVLYRTDPEVSHYRLLACDPAVSSCDSLSGFSELAAAARAYEGSSLGEFRTRPQSADRHLVVIAARQKDLLRSETIVARVASQPTVYRYGAIFFVREDRRLAWPRVPDAALYVVMVSDAGTGGVKGAVATQRKSWSYPQLVGIAHYFHDPATVPELTPGDPCVARLFAIDEHHWTTFVTEAKFEP